MSIARIQLTGLRVSADHLPPAEVTFGRGLTVVTGPSDTGKTYICGLVDYMLGAGDAPQDNPLSTKYQHALLGMAGEGEAAWTVMRTFSDDSAKLYRCPLERVGPNESFTDVLAAHRTGSTESLSHFLLSQIHLTGKQVKRTKAGERSSLTFRHVAHLVIIGEERIISKKSPALTEQFVKDTEERSVFSFFLTGQDESLLGPKLIGKKDRANLVAEQSVLAIWIDERKKKLGSMITPETDLAAELRKVDHAVGSATEFLTATQEQLQLLENNRADLWEKLQKARSQRLYLSEQLKRLELLKQFYDSDRARLATIYSAGEAFRSIQDGLCAVCGNPPGANSPHSVESFQQGCATEMGKLDILKRELIRGMSDLAGDQENVSGEINRLEPLIVTINRDLQDRLKAQNENGRSELKALFTAKERLLAAKQIKDEIAELVAKQQVIDNQLIVPKRSIPSVSDDTKRLDLAFCERVRQTLERWHFPTGSGVSFDPESFDIVINGQYRGSFGKGYRALTHAAFSISLMRHCREYKIPHPGFVLLDTPLNPLREPDKEKLGQATAGVNISDEMKKAFFEDLALDQSGDQYIVFENSEPPEELRAKLHYLHFTKNHHFGRYGFFPTDAK